MNIKKNLMTKKNVVNMLALILTGVDTNKKISKTLKREESTISEHLAPLKKKGIIYTRENRKNNEKNYEVDCKKIAEIFFKLGYKKFLKYKNNPFVGLTFAASISAKEGLLEKKPKEFDKVALVDIFIEVSKSFYYRGKALNEGKESLALQGCRTENDKIKKDFKEFFKLFYQHSRKESEKERKKEEENKIKEGKILVENVPLIKSPINS